VEKWGKVNAAIYFINRSMTNDKEAVSKAPIIVILSKAEIWQ